MELTKNMKMTKKDQYTREACALHNKYVENGYFELNELPTDCWDNTDYGKKNYWGEPIHKRDQKTGGKWFSYKGKVMWSTLQKLGWEKFTVGDANRLFDKIFYGHGNERILVYQPQKK